MASASQSPSARPTNEHPAEPLLECAAAVVIATPTVEKFREYTLTKLHKISPEVAEYYSAVLGWETTILEQLRKNAELTLKSATALLSSAAKHSDSSGKVSKSTTHSALHGGEVNIDDASDDQESSNGQGSGQPVLSWTA